MTGVQTCALPILLVGQGRADLALDAGDGRVLLDSADFVVNTDYVGSQTPSTDFEANGFQLGATRFEGFVWVLNALNSENAFNVYTGTGSSTTTGGTTWTTPAPGTPSTSATRTRCS